MILHDQCLIEVDHDLTLGTRTQFYPKIDQNVEVEKSEKNKKKLGQKRAF